MTESPPATSASEPRVLLVDPYMAREDPMERKFIELYPSLGLLQLGAYLQGRSIRVAVERPHVLPQYRAGRDARCGSSPRTYWGSTRRRSRSPGASSWRGPPAVAGVFSVAGGPDSATRPSAYLEAGFDAVVTGEGEELPW